MAARVAANSMANGMPSRCRQIAAIAERLVLSAESPDPVLASWRSAALPRSAGGPHALLPMLRWHLQRRDAIDAFAFYPQRLSACRQHGRARTNAHHRFHQFGRRIDDVLAIVEDQEELSFLQWPARRLRRKSPRRPASARGHRRPRRAPDRDRTARPARPAKRHPKGREQVAGDLQRQRRLTDPTGPVSVTTR